MIFPESSTPPGVRAIFFHESAKYTNHVHYEIDTTATSALTVFFLDYMILTVDILHYFSVFAIKYSLRIKKKKNLNWMKRKFAKIQQFI